MWESNSDYEEEEEEKDHGCDSALYSVLSSSFRTELCCCLLAGEMNDDLISM